MTYPKLDVKRMIEPILRNYDEHVNKFLGILSGIHCELVYDGPTEFHDHVRDKTVYACSVRCHDESGKRKYKLFRSLFPVMLGSALDTCIRKNRRRSGFCESELIRIAEDERFGNFETADVAVTFFLINGCVKQLPYFFTNDPTNTHVVHKRRLVRCYTYDAQDRGKELSLHLNRHPGEMAVVLNDGSKSDDVQGFFDHCPYRVDQDAYMYNVYHDEQRRDAFDIDHLANKTVVSPGHLFVKLFVKYLFWPVKKREWSVVQAKHKMVLKSIESGTLLHVLSRKTLYFKENNSASKMVKAVQDNHREIGMNGEVYVEKNTGCYREISMQTYPLNPYLSHLIVRQISSKVKKGVAFHPSYVGFLCLMGNFETKNVGRTNMMVRNTFVSTCDRVELVYERLRVRQPPLTETAKFFLVVNEACVPVTRECFDDLDLDRLKRELKFVECLRKSPFVHVRYKAGLLFKRMGGKDGEEGGGVWITSRDESFWANRLYPGENLRKKFGHDYNTGYLVDLNPFFNHNMFAKNILAFSTLKNAVLSKRPEISEYFMETFSAFASPSPDYDRVVCEPVDDFSRRFALEIPLLTVAYMSFEGDNQEDCIAMRSDLRAFQCFRFYTVRLKFESGGGPRIAFHPVRGDVVPDDCFLGDLLCLEEKRAGSFSIQAQTTHVKLRAVSDRHYKIFFSKPHFAVVSYTLTDERLAISLREKHDTSSGDKLCSFHGQKGVLKKKEKFPLLDEKVVPDLIVNPYSMFRMTCGQIKEGLYWGGGDSLSFRNSLGERIPCEDGIFYGRTFYFPVAYWASEHIYAPKECTLDKILDQAVKGRSRGGGMRLGNMEILNGLRGNGIGACFEEKVIEHGDRIFHDDAPIPKSTFLCREDAKFYKCDLDFELEKCVQPLDVPHRIPLLPRIRREDGKLCESDFEKPTRPSDVDRRAIPEDDFDFILKCVIESLRERKKKKTA